MISIPQPAQSLDPLDEIDPLAEAPGAGGVDQQGSPLAGPGFPAGGWSQPGAWQPAQQPASRSGSSLSVGLIIGIGAGVLALVLLIGVVAVVLSIVRRPEEQQSAAKTGDSQPEKVVEQPEEVTEQPKRSPAAAPSPSPPPAAKPPASSPAPERPAEPSGSGSSSGREPSGVASQQTGPPVPLAAAALQWQQGPDRWRRGAIPAGKTPHVVYHYSWMTHLLPYLGHRDLYAKFDFQKPWAFQTNAELAQTVVEEFLNPADPRKVWKGLDYHNFGLTHFVGMAGLEERNEVAARLPRSDPRAGVFGYDEVTPLDQITDGTSQTIMVIGSGRLANPWVQGGGATVRGARPPYFDPVTGFGSQGLARHGAFVVMADGSTRFVTADVSPDVFRAMCTTHGSESVDLTSLSGPLEGFRLSGDQQR